MSGNKSGLPVRHSRIAHDWRERLHNSPLGPPPTGCLLFSRTNVCTEGVSVGGGHFYQCALAADGVAARPYQVKSGQVPPLQRSAAQGAGRLRGEALLQLDLPGGPRNAGTAKTRAYRGFMQVRPPPRTSTRDGTETCFEVPDSGRRYVRLCAGSRRGDCL
jgi:hypothetical protein